MKLKIVVTIIICQKLPVAILNLIEFEFMMTGWHYYGFTRLFDLSLDWMVLILVRGQTLLKDLLIALSRNLPKPLYFSSFKEG